MSEYLLYYEKVNPISWAYLSSLLMVALFFKFNRFWSVRNLDLILLILLAPGLLIVLAGRQELRRVAAEYEALTKAESSLNVSSPEAVQPVSLDAELSKLKSAAEVSAEKAKSGPPAEGKSSPVATASAVSPQLTLQEIAQHEKGAVRTLWFGYAALLGVCALLLVRLLFDPTMVRRPLLEPNLTNGGLLFIAGFLFLFLMANVITSQVTASDLRGAQGAKAILTGTDNRNAEERVEDYNQFGPGYYFLHLLPSVVTPAYGSDAAATGQQPPAMVAVTKTMAIISHLAVLSALIFIGYWHFENIKMGIGAATMYLMLPYTSQMTGHVDHVLPAALLLWAIVLYRRPALAGLLIGLAMSTIYYPFFLLPLWLSFYWQRGVLRFVTGLLLAVGAMVVSLIFVSEDLASFWAKFQPMFGIWIPKTEGLAGIWAYGWDPVYRLPVIVACAVLGGSMALWPAQKNLGTLLSCSAAVMIAIQFWHAHRDGGGLYLAWFLPLALLTIFRPNLEDRVALSVLGEDWFTRRRAKLAQLKKAA